jgi:hypothetical protein
MDVWQSLGISEKTSRAWKCGLIASPGILRKERFKEDIDAYHRHYAVPADLHAKREYLLTIGRRR